MKGRRGNARRLFLGIKKLEVHNDICTEIIVREKQRAVGIQPMLFLCLPILCLKFGNQPIGRILEQKEKATWNIGVVEVGLAVELFRMFGMLSQRHRSEGTVPQHSRLISVVPPSFGRPIRQAGKLRKNGA